jgi:hypothetical protein
MYRVAKNRVILPPRKIKGCGFFVPDLGLLAAAALHHAALLSPIVMIDVSLPAKEHKERRYSLETSSAYAL